MSKTNKHPNHQEQPSSQKNIRTLERPESTNSQTIAWHFGIIDCEHQKWGCKLIDQETLWNIIFKKIIDFETRTWGNIENDKKKNHYVPVNEICPMAKKRLKELKQEDIDNLFVIHFNNKNCLWGIREGRVFKILWWDPLHEVRFSEKKNT